MKIIDKLIDDGVINKEDKERIIHNYCPSKYGYTDNHISSNDLSVCKECWNREVEEYGIYNSRTIFKRE